MWNEIKNWNWLQWVVVIFVGVAAVSQVTSFIQALRCNQQISDLKAELRAELQAQQPDRPLIDIEKPIQQVLTQLAQANQRKTGQAQSMPASMTNAITRMSDDINKLAQLVEQQREISTLLMQNAGGTQVMKSPLPPGAKVDRNGNTEEALNDLYSPVNVPVLPDALAKGLARHPGSRVVVHPETGIPVLSNCEWVSSHGGRVQEIKRLNGIERPISIHYSAPQPKPEPKPEPFRLNLGNN